MRPSEILSKAADLIETVGAWTQLSYARTSENKPVFWDDAQASCFCVEGALAKIAGGRARSFVARRYLQDITQRDIVFWNDHPKRTQAEVVAALRKAASLAAEKESV